MHLLYEPLRMNLLLAPAGSELMGADGADRGDGGGRFELCVERGSAHNS